jgi:xylulokinase
MIAAPAPLTDPETIMRGYVQGANETERRFSYVVGSIFSSGGAMEWLRSILGDPSQETLISDASTVPPGSHGVVFLPHLVNSPPPAPDPSARGAFVGLTPAATPSALYRAVLEGLAMQSRLLLDGMSELTGVPPIRQVRLIGGVTRNQLFVSIKANVLGRPISVLDEPETTALGAALLAGVAAGVYPTFDAAVGGLRLSETLVEPDQDSGFYDDLRTTVFADLHDRLRPINEQLERLSRRR